MILNGKEQARYLSKLCGLLYFSSLLGPYIHMNGVHFQFLNFCFFWAPLKSEVSSFTNVFPTFHLIIFFPFHCVTKSNFMHFFNPIVIDALLTHIEIH